MSAFVVDPMDAQKPWQMSLGPLLCLWALGQQIRASDVAKLAKSLLTKPNRRKWATKCDGTEQTLMRAFVVDPMDAQKPWQVSLGPLLRLWALGQRIRASDVAKIAKSLTKAKSKEMGNQMRW